MLPAFAARRTETRPIKALNNELILALIWINALVLSALYLFGVVVLFGQL